jgi:phosphohistidine phosphatase
MAFDGVPVRVCRELEPGSATPDALEALARRLGAGWALVGHNPSMGFTLSHVLGLGGEAARFRKGAVAALHTDEPGKPWRLAWIVSPGRKKQKSVELD